MKKTLLKIAVVVAFLLPIAASAQMNQFAQATQLTLTTNSPLLATGIANIQLTPISLTIYATNSATIITNTIFSVVNFTNAYTFVYNASTMGTNFSTNFNNGLPLTFAVTNAIYGQASPQGGSTNIVYIK